ncbi:MAG TPA: RagB/SusD family nutrient uptake outer membrane protein, partial [Chitinophagaceae bacterium]|nr:RagB/SusD family nutrient uptake outer membrane protein [Chitinophagaceae bacterium]
MDYLAGVYEGLLIWRVSKDDAEDPNASLCAVTDEANQRYPSAGMLENQMITGSLGGTFQGYVGNSWSYLYTHIRAANIFLKHVDGSPLSAALKARTKGEARFLRAFFYSRLIEGWGGVPLVKDTVYDLNSHAKASRSTYADCVDYIITELDAIAPQLPASYSGLNYGRITKGACLALKSRVLLTAASPLFNGGGISTDENLKALTGYPAYDPGRWDKALKAAQDVVHLGQYQLETDNTTKPGYGFYQVFLQRINPEYILPYMMGPNVYLETYNLPPSRSWWNGYHRFPTQELVDGFPMANGMPIEDPASGYDPDHPYDNRDPRFYYSIIYNGSEYYNKSGHKLKPVWTYLGSGKDAIVPLSSGGATHTGYYFRKMMDELIPYKGGGNTNRCLPVIRYAGILLNLAEAANETGNTALAMEQLIAIRKRAGIVPGADQRYGLPANPSQDDARELIHKERFIELAFEGQRFWDLRRWKTLIPKLAGKYLHGMEITKAGNDYGYKRIELMKHNYDDKLYLFPIPQDEVSLDRAILQNPGW